MYERVGKVWVESRSVEGVTVTRCRATKHDGEIRGGSKGGSKGGRLGRGETCEYSWLRLLVCDNRALAVAQGRILQGQHTTHDGGGGLVSRSTLRHRMRRPQWFPKFQSLSAVRSCAVAAQALTAEEASGGRDDGGSEVHVLTQPISH